MGGFISSFRLIGIPTLRINLYLEWVESKPDKERNRREEIGAEQRGRQSSKKLHDWDSLTMECNLPILSVTINSHAGLPVM